MTEIRPEYLQPSAGGLRFLYGKEQDSYAMFIASLTMHVDAEKLSMAADETFRLFPQFDICAIDGSEGIEYSPAADGKRLMVVSCFHKTVTFRYHRSIADEQGILSFIKSLLLRYLELDGFPVSDDGSVKSSRNASVTCDCPDPMRAVEDIPASRPIWYMDAKAFNADYSSDAEHVCQIRIPVSRLSRTMEPMAKTPVTYIAPLFSHAIYERYGEHMSSGEYVVASININLRPYFTAASLRPFCTPVYLAYNRILGDYPFNTVLMSQKKLLEAQLKTDALAYSAQRMISDVDLVMEHLPAQRAAAFMSLHDKIDSKSTYSISRVGNVTMPEQMQRYVTDLYPVHPCGGQAFAMTVINYRGELVVTVSGKNDLDSVTRRFVELLNENGIYSFMSDRFDLSSK